MKIKCIGGSSNGRFIDVGDDEIKRGYMMLWGPSISPTQCVKERYLIKEFRRQVIGGWMPIFYAVFDQMPQISDLEMERML